MSPAAGTWCVGDLALTSLSKWEDSVGWHGYLGESPASRLVEIWNAVDRVDESNSVAREWENGETRGSGVSDRSGSFAVGDGIHRSHDTARGASPG